MASNPSAIWRVRPGGNNLNGGGYDPSITGGTDYSQQDASQTNGTNGSGSGTTTFIDTTAHSFTSAMVGNAINIVGQGIYFVVTFNNNSNIILDRALATFTGASWRIGGGWADCSTNATFGSTPTSPVVPGNTIYILGGSSPTYGSPDYSQGIFAPVRGDTTNGLIQWIADPNTPMSNGYGGRPLLLCTSGVIWYQGQFFAVRNLFLVCGTFGGTGGTIDSNATPVFITGVVLDQNGYDQSLIGVDGPSYAFNCEVFSSVSTPHTSNDEAAMKMGPYGTKIVNCNIHDCIDSGIYMNDIGSVHNCVVAKNAGRGIVNNLNNSIGWMTSIINCTIDGNLGNGIEINNASGSQIPLLIQTGIIGNLITNHITTGTAGIAITNGTTAVNDKANGLVDYNSFYGNTTDHIGISAGANDVILTADPYTNQATEDYKLK